MTAEALENPGLRRMLRPAVQAPQGIQRLEAKSWRSSMPRVTENAISTVATVAGYDVVRTDLEDVLAGWDDFVLTFLLGGPDEARGLVRLDDELRTAIVEAQTVGQVMSTKLSGRPGTPIDAALCDHVVNAWMDGAAAASETTNLWKTLRIIKDARTAKVALDDGDYTAINVTVAMGGGTRVGTMRILRPAGSTMSSAGGGVAASGAVPAGFLALEAQLEAVLYRTKVPLAWLRGLEPGAVLEIPQRAINNVQIETVDGKRIVRARLGQKDGKRAVRLLDDDDDSEGPMPVRSAAPGGLPAPAPMGELPDLDGAAPMGGLPDLPGPEPMGSLPDLPPLEPMGDLPDLPPLEPMGDLPDLPPLEID